MISAIILAAGKSSRMGSPKLLLPIKEKALLQHVIDNTLKSKVDEVVLVLGAGAAKLQQEISTGKARIIVNNSYEEGQSTSLRAGLNSINRQSQAVLVLLGDQPLVTDTIINALIDKYRESGNLIVAPFYHGKRGNPVLFDASLIPELTEESGDKGGREIIERHADKMSSVRIESALIGSDIDTREDYQRITKLLQDED